MNSKVFAYKVSIIGTGNVAWHLCNLMLESGVFVAGVLTRDAQKARAANVGQYFNAPLSDDIEELKNRSDIIIIAVSDNAVPAFASVLRNFKGVVAHTAGSCPLSVLTDEGLRGAVLYPLQTLTKGRNLPSSEIPLCIEAVDAEVFNIVKQLAMTIGAPVQKINSVQRLVLHTAAVISCNFANHLWALSKNLLQEFNADFELLIPLINETFKKAIALGPEKSQTGPAARGDISTINRHLEILEQNPDLRNLYQIISDSIINKKN